MTPDSVIGQLSSKFEVLASLVGHSDRAFLLNETYLKWKFVSVLPSDWFSLSGWPRVVGRHLIKLERESDYESI